MPGSGNRSPAWASQEGRCLVITTGFVVTVGPTEPARGWLQSEGVPRHRPAAERGRGVPRNWSSTQPRKRQHCSAHGQAGVVGSNLSLLHIF